MTRKYSKRHRLGPPVLLSPQAIAGLSSYALPPPEPGTQRLPIVVDAMGSPSLLVGAARLAYHLRSRPKSLIEALCVPISDVRLVEAVRVLDAVVDPLPSERARAFKILADHGLGPTQLARLIPGVGSVSAASRWRALADVDPYILSLLDSGSLAFSHAVPLLPLSHSEQRRWAELCVSRRWSHGALVRAIRAHSKGAGVVRDLDVEGHARSLEAALGASVELSWDGSTGRAELRLGWFTVEELQGLMERLGGGMPVDTPALPSRGRQLAIALDSVDELEALTGHLFVER